MHIVFRSAEGDRDLTVDPHRHDATVQDLLTAVLGSRAPAALAVGDRVVPGSCPIADAGLHEGALLSSSPVQENIDVAGGLELVIVAGGHSGRSFPLPRGRSSIGREPGVAILLDDPTLSREHCVLEVDVSGGCTVTDLGSANGTLVDGVRLKPDDPVALPAGGLIELGVHALAIRPVTDADRPIALDLRRHIGPAGTTPFNRPPRPARPLGAKPIVLPKPPGEPSKTHFSVASTLGPLVMAGALIGITGNLQYALFMLLTPVIALGSYVESRRRSSKGGARSRTAYAADLGDLGRSLRAARDVERSRLRAAYPDPHETLRRAALPSVRLWERRPHHDDFLRLFAGIGDLPWEPPLKNASGEVPDDVAKLLDSTTVLRAAPARVDLSRGGVVGIVGDRATALATARSLVCQAAVHHGPADLTLGVFVDPGRAPDWDWSKWLPHTREPGGGGRWLSDHRDHSDALLRQLAAGAGAGTVLAVFDSDVLTDGKNSPARDLLRLGEDARGSQGRDRDRERGPAVAGIVIASSTDRLPSACNTVIEVDGGGGGGGEATIHRHDEATDAIEILLAGLADATAVACARDLARFEDPELGSVDAGLPDSVSLLSLLGLDRVDETSIRGRWQRSGRDPGAVVPLGVTASGVFNLDLVRDGPHGLIGGTTGSGKSELLKCLVAGLAAYTDPEHLTFILMDFKGGAAFDECNRLPHTVGMVTDLDARLGARALEALEAEIAYRERLLRSVGVDNLREYLARDPVEPMPRLLVVIDEFATMAKEFPEFLSALVSVAQRGRTLGVHMILATQRPSGAVNENIKTNTNLRIALRVQDADDSTDVIGRRDAAELSRHRPGRAYIRLGPGEVVPIQTALLERGGQAGARPPVDVTPFGFGPPVKEEPPADDAAAPDRDRDHDASPFHPTSSASSTPSSPPTTPSACRPPAAPGRSRSRRASTWPPCSPPPRRPTVRGRSSASPTTPAGRRSTPSAGRSTTATCSSSGSPAAGPPPRSPAWPSAWPPRSRLTRSRSSRSTTAPASSGHSAGCPIPARW